MNSDQHGVRPDQPTAPPSGPAPDPPLQRREREFCICAAVRLDDGRVIRGHRHDDCIQTALKWKSAGQDIGRIYQEQQGFVTSRGRFVGRQEAMQLQRAISDKAPAGHLLTGDVLISEDLY